MSGIKLLINGLAGAGKTDLLRTLGKETLVISRDAKSFALPLPHMLVDTYYNMKTLCYGGNINIDGESVYIDGILDKMDKYNEKMEEYPEIVVIDSVSQIFMDVIDKASQTPNVYGSQGAEVTKEMAILTSFIHEQLELNGISVILLNHVIEEKIEGKATGAYESFGSGKFLAKGGFYSTTNEAVTITISGVHRIVYTRGADKQARTSLVGIPDRMYVANTVHPDKSKKLPDGEEFFTLKGHITKLKAGLLDLKAWSI
jgi:hypothetical protein